ncbi:hypothetical protein HPB50_021232 [Hyalomma asiaticum]|uniref:Uncharacterized protein n=1 Tax=Hyalomma asiaticum TaxID=266040 RepID=A0ACB7RVR1_HYAAI|nr:hypothetical protein HPB50_021232 [Hyalomma asiaticum]
MPDSGNRFCLCHATAQQFQKGLSFFDCIPYQRESRCDLSDFDNCTAPAGSGLQCSRQLASQPSVVTGLYPGVTYAFCAIDENPLSVSGYDSFALCTRTWTLDSVHGRSLSFRNQAGLFVIIERRASGGAELRFRASAYSSFMVGLEWRLGNETEQLLNVRLCSSSDGCHRACRDNLLDLRREKFVAWTDLTKQRLSLQRPIGHASFALPRWVLPAFASAGCWTAATRTVSWSPTAGSGCATPRCTRSRA